MPRLRACADLDVVAPDRLWSGYTYCLAQNPSTLDHFDEVAEKPVAISVTEGRTLVKFAAANALRYGDGYMKRYDERVETAKRMLDGLRASGELDEIQYVRAHCYMGESYCNADGHVVTDKVTEYPANYSRVAPAWIADEQKQNFGSFINTYSHVTNLLRYLIGSQPTVDYTCLRSHHIQLSVLDYGRFVATLETGRSSSRHWEEQIVVFFADGRLTLDMLPALLRNTPARVQLYRAGDHQHVVSPQCGWTWSFKNQAQGFVGDVLSNAASRMDGSEGRLDLELAESISPQCRAPDMGPWVRRDRCIYSRQRAPASTL